VTARKVRGLKKVLVLHVAVAIVYTQLHILSNGFNHAYCVIDNEILDIVAVSKPRCYELAFRERRIYSEIDLDGKVFVWYLVLYVSDCTQQSLLI
jgi:hypothetical protein